MYALALKAIRGGKTVDPAAKRLESLTLEALVTDRDLASFPASPVQRAILRAADGLPFDDLIPDPDRREAHFGAPDAKVSKPPRIVILRSGVRSGKSLLAALACLIGGALRCSFRRLPKLEQGEIPDPRDGMVGVRPGELVRAPIVTPLVRQSRAVFAHCLANIKASPVLSKLLAKEPTTETMVIRRPSDGQDVLIEMVAASAQGNNLRSTWLAGVVFDEADFFDDEDAAITLEDNFDAAVSRLLPGAQAWLPSSPWADAGTYNDKFMAAFGRPADTLAFHSTSRGMNPTLDPVLEAAEYARDPEKASREFGGIPLSSSGKHFFPQAAVKACVNESRPMLLSPLEGVQHYGGSDLGFRKNSSALALARREGGKTRLAYYEELRPQKGSPLKPSEVCESFARTSLAYNATLVRGDLHYVETASEEFPKQKDKLGRSVQYEGYQPTGEITADMFTEFRRLLEEGALDLPNDPRLLKQLADVRTHPLPGGRVHIKLPKHGMAHADLLTAVVIAVVQVPTFEPEIVPNAADIMPARWTDSRGF